MSKQRHRKRYEVINQPRYITFSCYERLPLFSNDAIKDHFILHLRRIQELMQLDLHAWVIMPEHLHLLITPYLPRKPLPMILQRLKEPFAKQVIGRWRDLNAPILNRITDNRGRPHFWLSGGGYDRNIRDEEELNKKIAYTHDNPRRRGLVHNPLDWQWSSARYYAGLTKDILDLD